jgi:hypothetical protein
MRVHPSHRRLSAWHDGHRSDDVVTEHLASCDRCAEVVARMVRLDAIIAGLAPVPSARRAAATARTDRPRAVRAVAPVLAVLAGLVVVAALPVSRSAAASPIRSVLASLGLGAGHSASVTAPASVDQPAVSTSTPTTSRSAPTTSTTRRPAVPGRPQSPGPSTTPAPHLDPVILGLVVPRAGSQAAEAMEVVRLTSDAVARANASLGAGARQVALRVLVAEDVDAGTADLSGVTALIGGFGAEAPAGLPWLLPADPRVTGPGVVVADEPAEEAGVQLATGIRGRDAKAVVGVLTEPAGAAADSDLAAGFRTSVPVREATVQAGRGCAEVADLRRQGVTALAIAAGPQVVSTCLAAAAAIGWRPADGVAVPPSAAYAGVTAGPSAVQTVLGFPWPGAAGDERAAYLASVAPGAHSYRAVVSVAAVELAVAAISATGGASPSLLAGRSWRTGLVRYQGDVNTAVRIVTSDGGAWDG